MKFSTLFTLSVLCFVSACSSEPEQDIYRSNWDRLIDGPFAGAEIWTNPLQDWRVRDGALECFVAGAERNVYLLTHGLGDQAETLRMQVTVEPLANTDTASDDGYVGFRFGIKGRYSDYRDSAVRGQGTKAGILADGTLFVGEFEGDRMALAGGPVSLELIAKKAVDVWEVSLFARDEHGKLLGQAKRDELPASLLAGGLGLSCHSGESDTRELEGEGAELRDRVDTRRTGSVRYSFRNWVVGGNGLAVDASREFGPIAFAMYTADRGTLKVTAQMLPLPAGAGQRVALQLGSADSDEFETVQVATIDPQSYTAHFRLEDWSTGTAVPYRLHYEMTDRSGERSNHFYRGRFSVEPAVESRLVVASLSCHLDLGFPHQNMVRNVLSFSPHAVIFSGDQIYEGNAGYGVQRAPLEPATLDYLRKWYQFGWAFRDVFRDRPSVFAIDDHDVYHGNIWGSGGRAAVGVGAEAQDSGGYKMDAEWVKIVHRTQTAHLPDPFDSTPVQQGIPVYYTDMTYGGVSFAVIEDRKWKSAPSEFLPQADIYNGFARNAEFDARETGDVDGAQLLGQRQLDFLEHWAADWADDVRMKVLVSATLFSSVQTRPRAQVEANIDRGMSPVPAGEYPTDDIPVQDFDTNGWPQTPRQKALLKMRKGFALHVAGDTHLGTTFQYGIDSWNDGSWAVGSPAISNVWPRRWFPREYPLNYKEGMPRNLGEYHDGFGNPITVLAVANPTETSVEPVAINERAPGYNILTFDPRQRSVEIEAWPRWVDPTAKDAQQFDGWPVTLNYLDNGYPRQGPRLPVLKNLPLDEPVVQVVDQQTGEIVYTVRLQGRTQTLRVFDPGIYTVRVLDGDMNLLREIEQQVAE